MSDIAITVENLGKEYRIGTRERHDTLRDAIAGRLRRRRDHRPSASERGTIDHGPSSIVHGPSDGPSSMVHRLAPETFWALKDVSFEVHKGEVVGVIGRNGAGKSTLLKILSRITEPTAGRAVIHGRVGSLLEVGTGFHPELTGRENIYLNGAILGMRRAEIDRRFDEIVAFSEIERFLDTPVKRYSSGMYVRLAFAVAAHLEPEVLIVDEVLAVGDAAFQKKCLGKMGDVAGEGRTVIFVSHNMAAVENLCRRTVLIEAGRVICDGESSTAIDQYMRGLNAGASARDLTSSDVRRSGTAEALLQSAEVLSLRGGAASTFLMGEGMQVRLRLESFTNLSGLAVAVGLYTPTGIRVAGLNSSDIGRVVLDVCKGQRAYVNCVVPEMNLAPGVYVLNLLLRRDDGVAVDYVEGALAMSVVAADAYGTGRTPAGSYLVFLPNRWEWGIL